MREYCGERLASSGSVYDEDDCGYMVVSKETKTISKGTQSFAYRYNQYETKTDLSQ